MQATRPLTNQSIQQGNRVIGVTKPRLHLCIFHQTRK